MAPHRYGKVHRNAADRVKDFLLATAGFLLVIALIVFLEWRSARMDRKAAGLRSANKGPRNG